jgi:hypothetical protein
MLERAGVFGSSVSMEMMGTTSVQQCRHVASETFRAVQFVFILFWTGSRSNSSHLQHHHISQIRLGSQRNLDSM